MSKSPTSSVGAGSATGRIADYISECSYPHIPADVVRKAKQLILDCIACSIGGGRGTPSRIILDYFCGMGGRAEATVLATGDRLPAPHAAYVNAYNGNILDYDDTYKDLAHPAVTTILPALAAAEKIGNIDGRAFINAVVAGYEVSLRVAKAIAPSAARYDEVFGFTTHQVFGGSTAVAKLLRLDTDGIRRTLGLAGVTAPVPHIHKNGIAPDDRPLSWQKGYGTSAMVGINAGFLALAGLQANRNILDGPKGFWIMAGSDRCDWDALVAGLGESFEIHHSAIKPWPACRLIHSTLDAADALRSIGIKVSEIDAVEVRTLSELARDFVVARPEHLPDANFSLPFVTALVLAGRNLRGGLVEHYLHDEEVLALADRIRVIADPAADAAQHTERKMISTVSVRLRSSAMHSRTVAFPKGAPENDLSSEDIVVKARALIEPVLGATAASRLIETILDLEKTGNVADLCDFAMLMEKNNGIKRVSA